MELEELVVPLREQPNELGSRREHTIIWTVPEGWESKVLRIVEGTKVPLNVAITTIDDGVYAEVDGKVVLEGQCVRCLKPIAMNHRIRVAEVYTYPDRNQRRRGRKNDTDDATIEVTGDELDPDLFIERETIDLESSIRDAVFADAPFKPLCSKGCLGICEHCGVLLADAEPGHSHEFLDPRFQALAGFFSKGEGDEVEKQGENATEEDSK